MSFLKKRVAKDFDIIIGTDSSINGELKSSGSVRVDGNVSGSIKSQGDVIIGANAVVDADIDALYCEISGKVSGSVHSESQLRILQSGSLTGDIIVSSFAIEEGGIFRGNCDINPDKKETRKTSKKAASSESKHNDSKKDVLKDTQKDFKNKQHEKTGNNK